MKTTKNRSKMLLAGIAAMALLFGLVLAGCDNGSNDPCCTAETWEPLREYLIGEEGEELGWTDELGAKLPECCKVPIKNLFALYKTEENPSEAAIKATTGCCYDSLEAWGLFDI